MKWKISKLSINNFKVFKALTLSIEGSNIVTLDGPNGFGKTSIFDALELLFTGRIRRVLDTYDKVEGSKTSKPKDHLLWNKHHAGDLSIKVELENIKSNERIYFCRFAKSSDLKNKDNCKPNLESFKIFKLCWLSSLDDDDFTNIFQDKDLETFLDVNHMENYGVLNYLEQGSNHFLYENNTKTRKEKLSHLFNVDYTKTNISNVTGMISLINSSYLKKEKKDFIASLSEEIKALKSKNVASDDCNDSLVYNRISDLKSVPLWDSKLPVVSDNTKDFNEMIILVEKLIVMSENKDEIKKRESNKKIIKYANRKDLKSVVNLYHSLGTFEIQDEINKKIILERRYINVLKSDINKLSENSLLTIKEIVVESDLVEIRKRLTSIKDTENSLSSLSKILLNIKDSRNTLISNFGKQNVNDKNCPLCGHDWVENEKLSKAFKQASGLYDKFKTNSQAQIEESSKYINDIFTPLHDEAKIRLNILEEKFNEKLYKELIDNKSILPTINNVGRGLESKGILLPKRFISDNNDLNLKVEDIKCKILNKQQDEIDSLPLDWEESMRFVTDSVDKFLIIETNSFIKKVEYIRYSYQVYCSSVLKDKEKLLNKESKTFDAALNLKKKLSNIKTQLNIIEKEHTEKTIGDIEVLFHIYSGRIIQNYQRGLGLFIDSGDGNKIRFYTAEPSGHDALLSMSSGQISALSLSFFLSLNMVYTKMPYILIDDPVQCMDDINIASLSDLLRNEFSERQILLSTHDSKISNYIRYKFKRAGLTQKPLNIQSHYYAKEPVMER